VIHGSKAVGEPPLMLAISVREAIRDAVAAFGKPGGQVELSSPATSEAIFFAVRRRMETMPPHADLKPVVLDPAFDPEAGVSEEDWPDELR
jgi:hypothetical protein